ncbi:hypothetical protein Droror1_Dr00017301 [Drosera rotundifolia]
MELVPGALFIVFSLLLVSWFGGQRNKFLVLSCFHLVRNGHFVIMPSSFSMKQVKGYARLVIAAARLCRFLLLVAELSCSIKKFEVVCVMLTEFGFYSYLRW